MKLTKMDLPRLGKYCKFLFNITSASQFNCLWVAFELCLALLLYGTLLPFRCIGLVAMYSCVPNKRVGPNKRAGWKMGQNQINVQGQINMQGGKMLNLDNLVG